MEHGTRHPRAVWPGLLVLALLAVSPAVRAGAERVVPAPARVAVIQRLGPAAPGVERLTSEHFDLQYDPERLTKEQVGEAQRLAEAAFVHNHALFGSAPDYRLRIDLTPDFQGATGFFKPGDPTAKDVNRRPFIGVRFGELDYLGLPAQYVLRHEIAHWFSGELAGGPLGEGIADWAAGEFAEVPARPWWGEELRKAGLWIDPEAFFITGDFDEPAEVDAPIRTANYAESALLIRFLVDRFGWEKFRAFAAEYGDVRGPLTSNEVRRRLRAPRFPRRSEPETRRRDPRLPPDATAVRALFEKHFGKPWPQLRADWETSMRAEPAPPEQAENLVLAFRIYGAIRNYEMWLIQQRTAPSREWQQAVRQAFTTANRLRKQGDYPATRGALANARSLVQQLREPRVIARSEPWRFGQPGAPHPGLIYESVATRLDSRVVRPGRRVDYVGNADV